MNNENQNPINPNEINNSNINSLNPTDLPKDLNPTNTIGIIPPFNGSNHIPPLKSTPTNQEVLESNEQVDTKEAAILVEEEQGMNNRELNPKLENSNEGLPLEPMTINNTDSVNSNDFTQTPETVVSTEEQFAPSMNDLNTPSEEISPKIPPLEQKQEEVDYLNQNPIQPPTQEIVNSINTKKTKNKKPLTFILLILLLLGIGAAGYFYVYPTFFKKNNINPYEIVINSSYENLESFLENFQKREVEYSSFTTEPITIQLNGKIESDMDALQDYVGIDYRVRYGADLKNKKMSVGLAVTEKSQQLLNAILYANKNKLYLKSNFFDKIIDLDEMFEDLNFEDNLFTSLDKMKIDINYEQANYLLTTFKNILIGSIDKSKITNKSEKITLGGKEYNTTKYTYVLDKANMERTINYIREQILKDDKFITDLVEFSGILDNEMIQDIVSSSSTNSKNLKEEAENEIKSALKENVELDDFQTITICLYSSVSNQVLAGDIKIENADMDFYFENIDGETNVTINFKDETKGVFNYKDGLITFKSYYQNEETVNATLESKADAIKLNINVNYDGLEAKMNFSLTDMLQEEKKATGKLNFGLNVDFLGENMNFSFTGDYSIEEGIFDTLDVSNSVKYQDLSDEDLVEIIENATDVFERFGLVEYLPEKPVLTNEYELLSIIDTTIGSDLNLLPAEEEFYRDEHYIYKFGYIKSNLVKVNYMNGTVENVKEALKNGHIKISDLDRFQIAYFISKIEE